MIIADENIDYRIIKALRKVSIDVISVCEDYTGICDEDVIFLSKELKRVILTEDKDFGDWVFAHKIKGVSVILLRYNFKDVEKIIPILCKLISEKQETLDGKFSTITIYKIRTRVI